MVQTKTSAERADSRRFLTTLSAVGSRFVVPASPQPILTVEGGEENARLTFGEGDLTTEVAQLATLAPDNTVTIPKPSLSGLRIAVAAVEWSLQRQVRASGYGCRDAFPWCHPAKAKSRGWLLFGRPAERLREVGSGQEKSLKPPVDPLPARRSTGGWSDCALKFLTLLPPESAEIARRRLNVPQSVQAWPESRAVSPLAAMRGSGGSFALPLHAAFAPLQGSHRRRSGNRCDAVVCNLFQPIFLSGRWHSAQSACGGIRMSLVFRLECTFPWQSSHFMWLCGRCVKGPCWIHRSAIFVRRKAGTAVEKVLGFRSGSASTWHFTHAGENWPFGGAPGGSGGSPRKNTRFCNSAPPVSPLIPRAAKASYFSSADRRKPPSAARDTA